MNIVAQELKTPQKNQGTERNQKNPESNNWGKPREPWEPKNQKKYCSQKNWEKQGT